MGMRHLLPLLPWCALLSGAAWSLPMPRWCATLRFALLAWLVVANARVFPEYLANFNEFVGGPAGGRHLLVGSNLDWGQDLARLAKWQEREHVDDLQLAAFGIAPPSYYGIRACVLPSYAPIEGPLADPWTPGTFAISATQFEALYFVAGRRETWDATVTADYARLMARPPTSLSNHDMAVLRDLAFGRLLLLLHDRARTPDEVVGASILIFRLGSAEMAELRQASLDPVRAR